MKEKSPKLDEKEKKKISYNIKKVKTQKIGIEDLMKEMKSMIERIALTEGTNKSLIERIALTEGTNKSMNERIALTERSNKSLNERIALTERSNKSLKLEVQELKEKNKFLNIINRNFYRRINLEYFLRAYFDIPFNIILDNQGELLRNMFEEIKLNCSRNQKDKSWSLNTLFDQIHYVIYIERKPYVGNKLHRQNIVLNLLNKYSEIKKNMRFQKSHQPVSNFGTFDKDFNLDTLIDIINGSKSNYGEFSSVVHEKVVFPISDLGFDDDKSKIDYLPLITITNYFHPLQENISFYLNNVILQDQDQPLNDKSIVVNCYDRSIKIVQGKNDKIIPDIKHILEGREKEKSIIMEKKREEDLLKEQTNKQFAMSNEN